MEIADVMSWMLMRYTLGISGVSECELSDSSGISSFRSHLGIIYFGFVPPSFFETTSRSIACMLMNLHLRGFVDS